MRRFMAMISLIAYLLGTTNVYANNVVNAETRKTLIELNILDEDGFCEDKITREDCLITIMRVIGATDDEIQALNAHVR